MKARDEDSRSDTGDRLGDIGFIDRGGMSAGLNSFISHPDGGPWTTLEIYQYRVILRSAFRANIDLAKEDITRIAVEDGLLGDNIRIYHARRDCPPYIVFHTFHLDSVIEGFRRVGYEVECD